MAKQTKKEKTDSQKQRLEAELVSLLPEIEEEGLVFLLRQAGIIIHNQRTDKLNQEMEILNKKKKPGAAAGSAASQGFEIEISRSDDGKTYYFIVNGMKHFFDIPETQKIIALCYRPPTKSDALRYLHEFFRAERDEILMDHKITSAKSPFFEELFKTVRATFQYNG
jgi:hypothetical protein